MKLVRKTNLIISRMSGSITTLEADKTLDLNYARNLCYFEVSNLSWISAERGLSIIRVSYFRANPLTQS